MYHKINSLYPNLVEINIINNKILYSSNNIEIKMI